jgi:hypothetical protein
MSKLFNTQLLVHTCSRQQQADGTPVHIVSISNTSSTASIHHTPAADSQAASIVIAVSHARPLFSLAMLILLPLLLVMLPCLLLQCLPTWLQLQPPFLQ